MGTLLTVTNLIKSTLESAHLVGNGGSVSAVYTDFFRAIPDAIEVFKERDFRSSPCVLLSYPMRGSINQGVGSGVNQQCRFNEELSYTAAFIDNDFKNSEDRFVLIDSFRDRMMNLVAGTVYTTAQLGAGTTASRLVISRREDQSQPESEMFVSLYTMSIKIYEVSNGA